MNSNPGCVHLFSLGGILSTHLSLSSPWKALKSLPSVLKEKSGHSKSLQKEDSRTTRVSKKKRVGLFGGTFDPIHFGHLNLAAQLKQIHHLDEVWFVPTSLSPFKNESPPVSALHRLNMLKIALEGREGFSIWEHEIHQKGPCYTIETVLAAIHQFPEYQFFLLLGEDALVRYHLWNRHKQLLDLIPFLIGARPKGEAVQDLQTSEDERNKLKEGVTPIQEIKVSSTDVRLRLKEKLDCEHLVPRKVLDYIYENQLYSSPEAA